MLYEQAVDGKVICIAENEEELSKQNPAHHDCLNHVRYSIGGDGYDVEVRIGVIGGKGVITAPTIVKPFCGVCGGFV